MASRSTNSIATRRRNGLPASFSTWRASGLPVAKVPCGNAGLVGHIQRLIAFDLDGTLIDSRRDLADSANQLISELGGTPLTEEAVRRMVGDGAGCSGAGAGGREARGSRPRPAAVPGDLRPPPAGITPGPMLASSRRSRLPAVAPASAMLANNRCTTLRVSSMRSAGRRSSTRSWAVTTRAAAARARGAAGDDERGGRDRGSDVDGGRLEGRSRHGPGERARCCLVSFGFGFEVVDKAPVEGETTCQGRRHARPRDRGLL